MTDKLIKEAEQIMRKAAWLGTYVLDGKKPVPCYDTMEWGRWFETADRHVAYTKTGNGTVSTIFLGVNHNFRQGGKPIFFETMVLGGIFDKDMQRYSTWGEAEEGHKRKVKYVTELK